MTVSRGEGKELRQKNSKDTDKKVQVGMRNKEQFIQKEKRCKANTFLFACFLEHFTQGSSLVLGIRVTA